MFSRSSKPVEPSAASYMSTMSRQRERGGGGGGDGEDAAGGGDLTAMIEEEYEPQMAAASRALSGGTSADPRFSAADHARDVDDFGRAEGGSEGWRSSAHHRGHPSSPGGHSDEGGRGGGRRRGGGKKLLGTMMGVFVPVVVNVVGLTLFVRLPFIVGQAGLVLSIFLYLTSVAVTSLTLLSICALATNGEFTQTGGAYYLISRSLGPEFGGTIGLTYSTAMLIQVCACCNVIGTQLSELIVQGSLHADPEWEAFLYTCIALGVFVFFALGGPSFFSKFNSVTVVVLSVSIVFVTGR